MIAPADISPDIDREAWLEERRNGIGASEAAAVLGVSPFETPLDLYLRKTGALPDAAMTEAMEIGLLMEPVLAELYQRRTGRPVTRSQKLQRSKSYPFLFATLDATDDEGDPVEFKTTNHFSGRDLGEEETDELPDHWITQAQCQMFVTGREVCNLAVLVGGQDFRRYRIDRNERLLELMLPKLEDFWGHVERRERVEFTEVPTAKLIAAMNPKCAGDAQLDDETIRKILQWERLGESIRETEKVREDLKREVLLAFGTSEFAPLPDGRRAKRYLREVSERTQVVRAHVQHYFSIVKGKEK